MICRVGESCVQQQQQPCLLRKKLTHLRFPALLAGVHQRRDHPFGSALRGMNLRTTKPLSGCRRVHQGHPVRAKGSRGPLCAAPLGVSAAVDADPLTVAYNTAGARTRCSVSPPGKSRKHVHPMMHWKLITPNKCSLA